MSTEETVDTELTEKLEKELLEKKSPVIRIFALILLLIYVGLLGTFVYFIITGSEYILAMLFVVIIYPVVMYLLVWIKKVFS